MVSVPSSPLTLALSPEGRGKSRSMVGKSPLIPLCQRGNKKEESSEAVAW